MYFFKNQKYREKNKVVLNKLRLKNIYPMTRCHIEYEVSSFWTTGDHVRTFEQKNIGRSFF